MGKNKDGVTHIDTYDFAAKEFCPEQFRTNFGLNDGCIQWSSEGLVVNSKKFTRTAGIAENNADRADGWRDNYKQVLTTRLCHEVKHCRETVISFRVAAGQFFCADNPFPTAFAPRVANIQADPRLANGMVFALQPETGLIFGFTITNQAIHAMYGRLPYARTQQGCAWAIECDEDDCTPCQSCPKIYTCQNFREDPAYRSFKIQLRYDGWLSFMHFIRWCENCGGDMYNWSKYAEFCSRVGPLCCDTFSRERWLSWASHNDWEEYQYFLQWKKWRAHEKEFGKVPDCLSKCSKACNQFVYYSLPSSVSGSKCVVDGCATCNACPPPEPVQEFKRECYAYQWGAVRCCCDCQGAAFLSLIEVARTEACEPLRDFKCLSIGIDRSHSTLRWMINNVVVHTHVGIGRRTAEEYRVRENGGYAEDVDVSRVLVGFGTGSILDASMPSNYWRHRSHDMSIDSTALVPLLCPSAYFNPYPNKLGELIPSAKNQTLAFATFGRSAQESGLADTDKFWRLFGQGAILVIKNIHVFRRKLVKYPVYAPSECDYHCYDPLPPDHCRNGSCHKSARKGGCCGANCDAPSGCDDKEIHSSFALNLNIENPIVRAAVQTRVDDFGLADPGHCSDDSSDDEGIAVVDLYK